MAKKIKLLTTLVAIFYTAFLFAEAPTYALKNEADQARFKRLTFELRCPKCQNQDLADSNAPIAADLRNQIVVMMNQGKSDSQIIDYMVARYGEFVLYNPRFGGYNRLLWLAPLLLVLIGLVVVVMIAKNRKPDVLPLTDENKRAQLDALLEAQPKDAP